MLLATCAATAAVKEGLAPSEALAMIDRLAAQWIPKNQRTRPVLDLLLVPSGDYRESLEITIGREPEPVSDRYKRYQEYLIEILSIQTHLGHYADVIVCGNCSVVEIQNRIRRTVQDRVGRGLRDLLKSAKTVWALGGLSESGKSEVGQLLARQHGVRRLKIGYLLENAAVRLGLNENELYALGDIQLAEELAAELDRYASAHTDQQTYSIESLHRSLLARYLKTIIGDRLVVVYVDAPFPLRLQRSGESAETVKAKDRVKLSRGAEEILTFADEKLENTGNMGQLRESVAFMVYRRYPRIKPEIQDIEKLSLPPAIKHWLDIVVKTLTADSRPFPHLIALTGSGTTGQWLNGWSDLDLLIVCDELLAPQLDMSIRTLQDAPSGTKVAYTVVMLGELDSLQLSPRLVHALRLIGERSASVVFCGDGFTVPVLPLWQDMERSHQELTVVVGVLRRLLLEPAANTKAIYKHVVLIAKLLLRTAGLNVESAHDVITTFNKNYPEDEFSLPSPSQISTRLEDEPDLDAVRVAGIKILNAYANRLMAARASVQRKVPVS
jgi:cytidylate kinase